MALSTMSMQLQMADIKDAPGQKVAHRRTRRRPAARSRTPLRSRPANYGYDITYASDCSGLDGGAAALKQMDISFRHAFASEKNSVYRAITAASHPDVEMIYNDMRDRPRDQLQDRHGHIDIYCAGFPRQSFAPNGNKHGTSVEDGALVWEVVRTIDALRPTAF
eukprot:5161532-Pyramimonas_sp.AAC.1